MFEFLFRYPRSLFSKGEIVLLGAWPTWILLLLIVVGIVGLGLLMRSKQRDAIGSIKGWRSVVLWALQSSMLAAVLTLLWQPALLVSTLKSQQNVVAVLVDDSQSMGIKDGTVTRLADAQQRLNSGLLASLARRFQVRLYRLSDKAERIKAPDALHADATATNVGESLKQVANETAGLPLGAVILMSDGADNSGGIDLETITDLRSRRVPIHTVGFGKEQSTRDVELSDVQAPARALAGSRISAQLTFQQRGYEGKKAKISVREGNKVVAMREITLAKDGNRQTETILFNAGTAGARAFAFSLDMQEGEENQKNNATQRLVNVQDGKPRILYIEGEPRWEFKFIRRALEDDKSVSLATLLRTTQNKFYRQGIDPKGKELEEGFPAKVEELFAYQGVIIGSVELNYFTTTQQELIKQFVDRRGGGLLMLGGRYALSEGGWDKGQLSEILPVTLPNRKGTFVRDPATVQLTPAGVESLITRLVEQPGPNNERWGKLPYLADYQDIGTPKLGAAVLAQYSAGGRKDQPLLVTQNYGRGRTAVLATSGTWRWQMQQPLEDQTHEIFWQQTLRWLVTETPGQVISSTPKQMLFDESRVRLTVDVRDKSYLPASDAQVEARVMGPQGTSEQIAMKPDPLVPGIYVADYIAAKTGSYLSEFVARRGNEEVGRDVVTFQRQDGVAENFHTNQNRELLEKLSQQTGGRYWRPDDLGKLTDEIALSEAGITVREARDLWDVPAIFLALLSLRGVEWWLRRKWGVV
jgi:uncharacterized membrane protein